MYVAKQKQNKLTKLTLLLVWWVICVCLANNIGLLGTCSVKYNAVSHSAQQSQQSQQSQQDADDQDKCELSEHLINFEQHQVAEYALIMQFVILVLILWLLSIPNYHPPFTEPILHKGRRLHLTLCVFRE
ncbi:copper resistance protein [Photobacterium sanguinicancri]|uniref:copper resistance protein n=1 Tax=Photobacterium sanguinicancri TaxID=875932 RepID=UPI003D0A70BC